MTGHGHFHAVFLAGAGFQNQERTDPLTTWPFGPRGSWSWADSAMTHDQSGSQSVGRRGSDWNVWQTPPWPRALGEWHSTSALYVSGHDCSRRWLSLRHLVPVRYHPNAVQTSVGIQGEESIYKWISENRWGCQSCLQWFECLLVFSCPFETGVLFCEPVEGSC